MFGKARCAKHLIKVIGMQIFLYRVYNHDPKKNLDYNKFCDIFHENETDCYTHITHGGET